MSQKEAAWLLSELPSLVDKGVLDAAAAGRLRAHYAGGAGARPGWGMLLLAVGGAALVGLGVILIFAHNWDAWTPGVRVALSLLPLLAGQAACVQALRQRSRAWSEAAGLFTAIAAGASIALIAQTYQFGGDLPRFLLTWLLLALPLVYLLDASAVAGLVWLLALGWTLANAAGGVWGEAGAWPEPLRLAGFLALFSAPLPHLVRHLRRDRAGARVAWMLRVALPVFALGLAVAADNDSEDALWLIYAALAAVALLAGERYFSGIEGLWGNPLGTAGRLGVFVLALAATSGEVLRHIAWPWSTPMLLPLIAAAGAALLAWQRYADGDRLVAPLLGLFAPVFFLLPLLANAASGAAIALAVLYVAALAGALIRSGLHEGRLDRANEGAALLAGLVLLRFFDSDLSYALRGVGFIVTGASFFGAMLWLRRRLGGAAA